MEILKFKSLIKLLTIISILSIIASHDYTTEAEIEAQINESVITYGSAIKIENVLSKYNLYSNKYTWGTGSQLQIITSIRSRDDPNLVWVVKEKHNDPMTETGQPLMCNDIIRLEHSNTSKNLHSHNHRSWITDSQEACGFGNDGFGDINDNFKVICYGAKDIKVTGATQFLLQHVGTEMYLYINIKTSLFDERNCRNCPIMNHREVSLTPTKDKQCLWKIFGGLIFSEKVNDDEDSNNDD